MVVTRLQRRRRRNKIQLDERQKLIKKLTSLPIIKKVNIDEIKKSFPTTK